jgi:hypothetical protein
MFTARRLSKMFGVKGLRREMRFVALFVETDGAQCLLFTRALWHAGWM